MFLKVVVLIFLFSDLIFGQDGEIIVLFTIPTRTISSRYAFPLMALRTLH